MRASTIDINTKIGLVLPLLLNQDQDQEAPKPVDIELPPLLGRVLQQDKGRMLLPNKDLQLLANKILANKPLTIKLLLGKGPKLLANLEIVVLGMMIPV